MDCLLMESLHNVQTKTHGKYLSVLFCRFLFFLLRHVKKCTTLLFMMQEKNLKPLLVVSDAISGTSGLARITRDLTTRIHANLSDVYDLAVAGYGGCGSVKFGFPQYHLEGVQSDWVLPSLPEIVEDFAGNERCIVMFISDPSRLGWFSQPERLGGETLSRYPGLKEWLLKANIDRWIYAPVDASGPNDKLTTPLAVTLLGFDRILAYGPFGEGVIRRTIGDKEANKRHLTWIPHGIDDDMFFGLSKEASRRIFFKHTGAQTILALLGVNPEVKPFENDEILIGICATNQIRKDFSLGIEIASILARNRKIRLWIHTDSLERNWSIPALLVDYGMLDKTVISLQQISDEHMATAYSACDITLGIGPEGFGFPAAESLACQIPVITGSYAGAADFVPKEMQVDPVAFRYEGSYACRRPVYRAEDWATKAEEWIGKRTSLDSQYLWKNNWKRWEAYLREAVK
jgi:glycosyltransferase involved in cell wall biosynthesis